MQNSLFFCTIPILYQSNLLIFFSVLILQCVFFLFYFKFWIYELNKLNLYWSTVDEMSRVSFCGSPTASWLERVRVWNVCVCVEQMWLA